MIDRFFLFAQLKQPVGDIALDDGIVRVELQGPGVTQVRGILVVSFFMQITEIDPGAYILRIIPGHLLQTVLCLLNVPLLQPE